MFGPNGPTSEEFYINHWRQKPLFVKGGQHYFVELQFGADRFKRIAKDLEQRSPKDVVTSGDGVIFLQNVDRVDEGLARLSNAFAAEHGWNNCWFDAVKATSSSVGGIGSHYDDSDNFVLQQEGVKEWRLCSPGRMMNDEHRLRILGGQDVGNAVMENDATVYTLEPGDLLYIPIFWPHWGVTKSDSLSISLVCNSTNLIRELMPILNTAISEQCIWWNPLPIREPDGGNMREIFNNAWNAFDNLSLKNTVYEHWLRSRSKKSPAVLKLAEEVVLESSISHLAFSPPMPLKSTILLQALGADGYGSRDNDHSQLLDYNVDFLISELTRLFRLLCSSNAFHKHRASLMDLLLAIHEHRNKAGKKLLGLGELRLWIWRINQAIFFSHESRVDQLIQYLAAIIVPTLIASGWRPNHWTMICSPSSIAGFNLAMLRFSILETSALNGVTLMHVKENTLSVTCHNELVLKLIYAGSWCIEYGVMTPMRSLPSAANVTVCDDNTFLESFLPLASTISPLIRVDVQGINVAIDLLSSAWPSLAQQLNQTRLLVVHPTLAQPPSNVESFARSGIIIIFSGSLSLPQEMAISIAGQLSHEWICRYIEGSGGKTDMRYYQPSGRQGGVVTRFIQAVQSQFYNRLAGFSSQSLVSPKKRDLPSKGLDLLFEKISDGSMDPFGM